ncbi:hypothetical protein LEP1GSC097_0461 [Leptospira interrogans serovar Grippotyphosa str. UI 08368]|nr:hypothetical protein LEP1GSC097_0461 [Leptospira interrogans serovar Grippotyphosa str. UI 08368]
MKNPVKLHFRVFKKVKYRKQYKAEKPTLFFLLITKRIQNEKLHKDPNHF